ncbi:cation diffusion facilitator family transporter [Sulfurimonas sp.]|uniref:cation diffusion facilitator family transporter n=1 Tax=Sulfurimonas sp. TaxID=2022749 RepID=UPI0025EE70C8|nr:cation diffusion facilitator family transporter [Sulfurimonas sp.]MDD5157072.1 cation diffusion facilitator family transporter [Sulfurimonas sp.]
MTKEQKIKIVLLLNMIIVVAEVGAGVYANSMALLSDAFHNLGDVLAVTITFIALIYGRRVASEAMTFGFIRAEMMAAFVNALFLSTTMIFIIFESIQKFFHPTDINAPIVIIAASIALVANAISVLLLKESGMEHSHSHGEETHEHHHDANISAAYWHMVADAAISLGVVFGGVAIWLWNISWIDPLLSVLFSLFILKGVYAVLRQSFLSLMDVNGDSTEKIITIVKAFDEVHSIHDLHISRPNSKEFYCSMHLVLYDNPGLQEVEALLEKIRETLKYLGITHALLQPETLKYATHEILCDHHH